VYNVKKPLAETRRFSRVLIARVAPKNGCYGPEGARLVAALPRDEARWRLKPTEHFFVALAGRVANRFGWVAEAQPPITAADLRAADWASMQEHHSDATSAELPPVEWYESFLRSVEKYDVGTPMGCGWVEVKLPGSRKMKLNVHKVFFY
jgi:hypothetical protein